MDRSQIRRAIEEAYLQYPRHRGKKKGVDRLLRQIKTPERLAQFQLAVLHYAALVRREQTEDQYVKHFSTFAGEWEDFIENPLKPNGNPPRGGQSIQIPGMTSTGEVIP